MLALEPNQSELGLREETLFDYPYIIFRSVWWHKISMSIHGVKINYFVRIGFHDMSSRFKGTSWYAGDNFDHEECKKEILDSFRHTWTSMYRDVGAPWFHYVVALARINLISSIRTITVTICAHNNRDLNTLLLFVFHPRINYVCYPEVLTKIKQKGQKPQEYFVLLKNKAQKKQILIPNDNAFRIHVFYFILFFKFHVLFTESYWSTNLKKGKTATTLMRNISKFAGFLISMNLTPAPKKTRIIHWFLKIQQQNMMIYLETSSEISSKTSRICVDIALPSDHCEFIHSLDLHLYLFFKAQTYPRAFSCIGEAS